MKGVHIRTKGAREYPGRGKHAAITFESGILRRIALYSARFLGALILANANVFGSYSPFAIGFVAASGAGGQGAAALIGAVIGYTLNFGFMDGLRYSAIVIVMFFVMYIMRDMEISSGKMFPSVIASVVTLAIGAVQLLSSPAALSSAVYFVSEIILAGGCAYFYLLAAEVPEKGEDEPRDLRHTVSLLILLATVILPLGDITLLAGISVGRLIAVLAVMTGAYYGGIGAGTATGTALGMALDISSMGVPFFTMTYAFSGLIAGIFKKQGRIGVTISYILANSVAVLWIWEYTLRTTVLFEVFAASVIFMVLPGKVISVIGEFAINREAAAPGERPAEDAKRRLERLAGVFRELQDALKRTPEKKEDEKDLSSVYDNAAETVCRKCPLMYHCWQKDYQSTVTALNDAGRYLNENGSVREVDFPNYFSARCVNFPAFMAEINSEFEKLLHRRQMKSRTRENRELILRQYGDIERTLSVAAQEIQSGIHEDEISRRRLQKYMNRMEVSGEISVFRDDKDRIYAEISGEELGKLITSDMKTEFSNVLRIPVAEPELINTPVNQRIIIKQSAPLAALAATAAKRRSGQSVNGDSDTYFKDEDGKLFMLLSDGMGSGSKAHEESEFVVRLLEKFLKAGISPAYALKTLNTTMLLRGDVLISTVDMLSIDLFSGDTEIYKFGAAPTYVRRGQSVEKFSGSALSVGSGIEPMATPEVARLKLGEGDIAVMLSDGVTDGTADEWLIALLESYSGSSPTELAKLIIDSAGGVMDARDDMTVLAVMLCDRE